MQFIDFVDGVTVAQQTDELTGLTSRVVIASRARMGVGRPKQEDDSNPWCDVISNA